MSIDKKINYEDQRLTEKQKKKIKPANQGGGPNYLGKQETVTVPKKWLSNPDHVVAELAYITPREKKILLDANLYGSLKGKPNRGPAGIQSLQGDMGSVGGGGNTGGNNDGPSARERHMGLQGKTGKTDPSIGGGGVDRSKVSKQQEINHQKAVAAAQAAAREKARLERIRQVEKLIDRPTFGITGAAKVNLLSPRSIASGLLTAVTGLPFGVLGLIDNIKGYSPETEDTTKEDNILGFTPDRGDNGGIMNVLPTQTIQPIQTQPVTTESTIKPVVSSADRQSYYESLYNQLTGSGIQAQPASDIATYRTNLRFG